MNNPDILKKMQVMRINGEPMTLAEQRRFVKKLGMGRTPADDAREAAARDKRDRRAAKLAAAMAKRVTQFPRPRTTNPEGEAP